MKTYKTPNGKIVSEQELREYYKDRFDKVISENDFTLVSDKEPTDDKTPTDKKKPTDKEEAVKKKDVSLSENTALPLSSGGIASSSDSNPFEKYPVSRKPQGATDSQMEELLAGADNSKASFDPNQRLEKPNREPNTFGNRSENLLDREQLEQEYKRSEIPQKIEKKTTFYDDVYNYAVNKLDKAGAEQRYNEELTQNTLWKKTKKAFRELHNVMAGHKSYNISEPVPLEEETKQAKEQLQKEIPDVEPTEEQIQERAKKIFIDNDIQNQMHSLIDKALPSGYDRAGIWKELKLKSLQNNDILRSKIASAELFKSQIDEFTDFAKSLNPKNISQQDVEKYNTLSQKANYAVEQLDYLAENFDSFLKEAKTDDEKLELFKYNYNDWEKFFTNIWAGTKNIVGGSGKLLGELFKHSASVMPQENIKIGTAISEMSDNIMEDAEKSTAPFYRYKASEIHSWSDLGSVSGQVFSEQLPILASIYLGGPVGVGVVSASSGGQKIHEMEAEKQETGKTYTDGEKLTTGLLYAGLEYFPEKLGTLRILKDMEKTIASASKSSRKLFEAGALKESLKHFPKTLGKFGYYTGLETATERITTEGQMLVDQEFLDIELSRKQKSDMRTESDVASALMGGGMAMFGGTLSFIARQSKAYSDRKDVAKVREILKKIETIHNEIDTNELLSKKEIAELYKEMNSLNNKAFAVVEKNAKKGVNLSVEEKSLLIDINNRQDELKAKVEETKNSNLSEDFKKSKLQELEAEFNQIENLRELVLQGKYYAIKNNNRPNDNKPNNTGAAVVENTKTEAEIDPETAEYKSVIRKKIGDLFDIAQRVKDRVVKEVIRPVTKEEAQTIKEKTGIEVDENFQHTIDNYAINHILKKHGDQTKEAQRGQIGVTKSEIELIPDIIENYDTIENGGKNDIGRDTVIYTKTYSDGTTYVVEEVRTKRKELALNTMYKRKNRTGIMPTDKSVLPSTSETTSDTANIQQNSQTTKTENNVTQTQGENIDVNGGLRAGATELEGRDSRNGQENRQAENSSTQDLQGVSTATDLGASKEATENKGRAGETKTDEKVEYDFSNIKPVGRGFFGNIYDQFKGKAREAIAFLMQQKEGEATGALHHRDIGDIDLVWGNEKAGLSHIIDKHIEKHNDFSSVEEAGSVIEDVVTNGEITESQQPNKVVIEKDGYRVVVAKEVFNAKGEKLGDKNWVVTAFDNTRMPKEKRNSTTTTTLRPPDSNKGGRDVASEVEVSATKVEKKSESTHKEISRGKLRSLVNRLVKAIPALKGRVVIDEKRMESRLKELERRGKSPTETIKTEQGEVLGFVDPQNGNIYLNPNRMNANTPFHEIVGHTFLNIAKRHNPKVYNQIIKKLQGEKALMDQVRNDPNYSHLKTDEQIADELFARLVGDKGEQLFHDMQNRALSQKIQDYIREMWENLKKQFGHGEFNNIRNWSLEEFKNASLNDIVNNVTKEALSGKEIVSKEIKDVKPDSQNQTQFSITENSENTPIEERSSKGKGAVRSKLMRFVDNTFRSGSGLHRHSNKDVNFTEIVKGLDRNEAKLLDGLQFEAKTLRNIIKGEIKSLNKKGREKLSNEINDYLTGKNNGENLSEQTKEGLGFFRERVDNLSQEIINVIEGQKEKFIEKQSGLDPLSAGYTALQNQINNRNNLIQTIENNKGKYLTRSYDAFTDPKYIKGLTIPYNNMSSKNKKLINNAITYLEREEGFTKAEARAYISEYLDDIKRSGDIGFSAGSMGGRAVSDFLRKRKDLPQEFLDLLGQIKDPLHNYVNTVYNINKYLNNLKFQDKLLGGLLDSGVGKFTPEFGYTKLASETKEWETLHGLYVPNEFAEALKDAMPLGRIDNAFWRGLVTATSWTKVNKTVYSPTTTVRNFDSGVLLGLNAGHFFALNPKEAVKAAKQAWGSDSVFSDEGLRDFRNELLEEGIIGDGVGSGEFRALLSEYRKTIDRITSKNPVTGVSKFAEKTYAFGDDFYKVFGYVIEKSRLMEYGMSEADARKKAGQRIRGGYPTYSYLPRNIKALRRFPLTGSFISFNYETVRSTKNNALYAMEDLKAGRIKMAANRLVGMAIANSGHLGLASWTMSMFGWSDQEEKTMREFLPNWQENSLLIYTGKNEKGEPTFMDGTALVPAEVLLKPLMTAFGKRKDYDNVLEQVSGGMDEFLSSYYDKDVLINTLWALSTNQTESGKKIFNDDLEKSIKNGVNHFMRGAGPGIYNNFAEFMRANELAQSFFGEKITNYGREYTNKDALLALAGIRTNTINFGSMMKFAGYKLSNKVKEIKSDTHSDLDVKRRLSDDEIQKIFDNHIRRNKEVEKRLNKVIEAGNIFYGDSETATTNLYLALVELAGLPIKGFGSAQKDGNMITEYITPNDHKRNYINNLLIYGGVDVGEEKAEKYYDITSDNFERFNKLWSDYLEKFFESYQESTERGSKKNKEPRRITTDY